MSYDGEQPPVSGGVAPERQPRLLDQVRGRLRLKHYSLRTEQAYIYWIGRYIRAWLPRHPRDLDGAAVEAFLTGLATRDRVAASTQNQALSALLFLYREVLGVELAWMENVVRAKRPQRLPVVLSRAQVGRLLERLAGREALMAGLLYGIKPVVVGLILTAAAGMVVKVVFPNLQLAAPTIDGFGQFNWVSLIIFATFFALSKVKIKGKKIE